MKVQMKHMLVNAISSVLLAAPAAVFAQGLTGVTPFAGTSQSDLVTAIIRIVNYALILAGIVAAVFIVYGGVRYIISRGEEEAAEEAKNTILYAVIGLIVIGLAAALVNFVVTGLRQT
jgi:hypothetical protein